MSGENTPILGERTITFRAARINKELTMDEAARRLGLTRYTLSRYETGKREVPLSVAWEMSGLYQIPVQCFKPSS